MVRGRRPECRYNCIDRHLHKRGDQTAIIWEGDDPSQSKRITYRHFMTSLQDGQILRTRNVKRKGDRVTIYLPMIPEAAYAMLAARGSARSTRWCSRASRRQPRPAHPGLPVQGDHSPPMRACAAARRCR